MDIDAQYAEIVECGQRLVDDCEKAAAASRTALVPAKPDSMYNSLLDNEAVDAVDAAKYGVVINVSTLYIACDEQTGVDQVVSNLRVIDPQVLLDLVNMARQILDNTVDQCEYSTNLLNRLVNRHSKDVNNLLDFMNKITAMSKSLELDDNFYDVTATNISFDRIRSYNVDPDTNILVSAEPTTYDHYQLYSQVQTAMLHADDQPDAINLRIREATNDTDFNRMQYCLMCVEKFLLFREGYICESTAKLGNLALFHLCLVSESRPILNYSSNDLRGNILSYMIDMVVRSRLIQYWQRFPTTARLLNDMSRNYDNNNHVVRLCQMKSARDRAQHILNSLKNVKDTNTTSLTDTLNYDLYHETLQLFRLTIDGIEYYHLGSEFILKLGTSSINTGPRALMATDADESESLALPGSGGGLFESIYRNTEKIEEMFGVNEIKPTHN